MNNAVELGKRAAASMADFLQGATNRSSVGIGLGSAASVEIAQGMESNPLEPAVDNQAFRASIKRDVISGEARASSVQAQEEQDEHEACQAAKVRKLAEVSEKRGAGRPRKLESELKADIAKIIRDRANHIYDAANTLKRTLAEAEHEGCRQLGELPADIKSILVSAQTEIVALTKGMETVSEALAKTDIDSLINADTPANGQVPPVAPKLEDMKKKIFDETKNVFTVQLVAGNKAIAAVRSSVKKAAKSSTKKKAAAAASNDTPPVAKKLMAKFLECAGENHGVKMLGEDALPSDISAHLLSFLANNDRVKIGLQAIKGAAATHKWLCKEMQKNKDTLTYAMASFKPAVSRSFSTVLENHVPSMVVKAPKVPDEHSALIQDIFGPIVWTQSSTHCCVGVTPYGLPEVRLLTSGSYIVAGVPCANLRGETLKAKIDAAVTAVGFDEILEACSGVDAPGFWACHKDPYSMLVLPPQHVLMTIGLFENDKDGGSEGIRWSTMRIANKLVAVASLDSVQEVMVAYPELKGDEYAAWAAVLERFLIPAAKRGGPAEQSTNDVQYVGGMCWAM